MNAQGADGEVPDAELVRRFLEAGSPGARRDAFSAIYQRYESLVLGICARELREINGAQDAASETFIVAFRSLPDLRNPASLGGWLRRIALRRCREQQRQQRRLTELPEAEPEDEPSAYEQASRARKAQVDRLLAAVTETLTARQQQIYQASIRDGLRGQDLGELLGVSPAQASRLSHELVPIVNDGFGALILAREGRPHCARLAQILDTAAWDGDTFTRQLRERIVRHLNDCETCDNCATCQYQRRRLTGTYAPVLIPILIAPGVREAVDNAIGQEIPVVEATQQTDQRPRDRGAGPGPGAGRGAGTGPGRGRTRTRRAWQAGAALAVIALIVLVFVVIRPGSGTDSAPPQAAPAASAGPFRPVAYTTLTGSYLLADPEARPETLFADDEGFYRAGDAVWSADGRYLAWSNGHADDAVISLRDTESGVERSWSCQGCDIAFLGTRLIGTSAQGTGLVGYPADGGDPAELAVSGLPARSADEPEGVPHLVLLTAHHPDGPQVYATTGSVTFGESRPHDVYRLTEDGSAVAVLRTTDLVVRLALSDDGSRLAYSGLSFDPDTFAQTAFVALADARTGETIARTAVEGSGSWTVGDVWFDGAGEAVAVGMTTSGSGQPGMRSYRFTGDAWSQSDPARPVVEDLGGGWTATLTYRTVVNETAVGGVLTVTDGSTTLTLGENIIRIHPYR